VGNIVTVEANALLESSVTAAAYTAPTTPILLALMTANGDATTAGTEVTGGSYARQDITGVWGSASGGSITNSAAAINFAGMPSCTIVGIELWDSAVTPVRRWFGPLSANKVVNAGDTVTFSASSVSIQIG
jgi:hypothetical protein